MFLKHVQKVILEHNEPRTLQGLLEDYKAIHIILDFLFVVRKTLSSERMIHFNPVSISMTFSRISQTSFALTVLECPTYC